MKYLVGIDNGGTFSKAAVFDETGKEYASHSIPTKVHSPSPGFMQRDMEELWLSNAEAICVAVQKSGIPPEHIAAVSLSGHGKGLYLTGKNGDIIYDGILSTDSRAWSYVERWNTDGTSKRIYSKTKQKILACQPVSLLAWLRDNEPFVYQQIDNIFSVKDYVRFKLTGVANGEFTDFSGGNLVNLETGAYDRDLMESFGLGEVFDALPPLRQSFDVCGTVTAEASRLTGLPEGIPVAAGMFDVDACGIASGLVGLGKMCMIAGTWSINEFITECPIESPDVALNSMYAIPGAFLVEESSPTSAGNMEWFLQNVLHVTHDDKADLYAQINAWVDEIAPEESDVVFLPYLHGSAQDALARGSFVGLTSYHDRRHMVRAVYEGVVFSHMSHVETLLQHTETPCEIYLSGGAANSTVWVQMFADVLQIPIVPVQGKEIGALGAAMAAGIAAGLYTDYVDAARKVVKTGMPVHPRANAEAVYREKYARYLAVAKALGGIWNLFMKAN